VISGAFDAYSGLFGVLIGVAATVVVPYEAVLLALQLTADDTDEARIGLYVIDVIASLLVVLPLLVVVVTRAAQDRERGQRPRPWRALAEAAELLVPLAGTWLMLILAVAFLPGVVILAGLATGAPGIVLAGLIALAGSAVLNLVRLCLALPVFLIEDLRYGTALRRSAELVRGHWQHVFLTLLALGGCGLLLNLVATATAVATTGDDGRALAVAERTAAGASTILITPLIALGLLELYRVRTAAAGEAADT
jgi:hypothetical protein